MKLKKLLKQIQNLLIKENKTITCAESCTGGLIASKITSQSGSSSIFNGSIITYSNQIKNQELQVSLKTIKKYNVVSKEVVKEMLKGVKKKFNSSYAIATSGIAGPNSDDYINNPVGKVVIGIIYPTNKIKIKIFYFKGDRISIQKQATKKAFKMIFKELSKKY